MSKRKAPDNESATTKAGEEGSDSCPYLDTIQRSLLDFDFEPSCSISLQSGPHIYGCLVCGKFFRGRGLQTPANTHSLQEGHFVFVHLSKSKFYCLPDNYEIVDASLCDIAAALHPTFTKEEVAKIDENAELARDLFGRRYLPGFVGLNNLNKTDCINACVQALAHVPPLRDFFLTQQATTTTLSAAPVDTAAAATTKTSKAAKSSMVVSAHRLSQHVTGCFGELTRKLWSGNNYKSHLDPHNLSQAIAVASKNRFRIGQQIEAGEFMAWFLHQLHMGLGGNKKPGSSIIHKIFQGAVSVTTRQLKKTDALAENDAGEDDRGGSDVEDEDRQAIDFDKQKAKEDLKRKSQPNMEETTIDSHFLQLTLDISEKPLFRDDDGGLVIPQEPLVAVLKKFDGISFSDCVNKAGEAQRRRYRVRKLPPYLILHLARFHTNRFLKEKNPTIVAFPVKNLDLGDYVFPTDDSVINGEKKKTKIPTEDEVRAMCVSLFSRTCLFVNQSQLYRSMHVLWRAVEINLHICIITFPHILNPFISWLLISADQGLESALVKTRTRRFAERNCR